MYGSKCEFYECPLNCFNVSCNAESGMCDYGCIKSYYGKNCDKRCPLNCLNSTCFVDNGLCSHGCLNGYHGKTCECPTNCICDRLGNCSRCVDDIFYGPLCDQVCSYLCINRTCDILTGTCNRACKHGYIGNKCDDSDVYGIKTIPIDVIILATFVAVLLIYSVAVTLVLFRKRRTCHIHANEISLPNVKSNTEPAICGSVSYSDHLYAMPSDTSSGNVPLIQMEHIETRPS